jgi:hypothetical protein
MRLGHEFGCENGPCGDVWGAIGTQNRVLFDTCPRLDCPIDSADFGIPLVSFYFDIHPLNLGSAGPRPLWPWLPAFVS